MNNPKLYIQSGYQGKEAGALMLSLPRQSVFFSAVDEYKEDMIPVGTVEFVEQFIGVRRPDYYPEFLRPFFKRNVWESEFLPDRACFIKPADRHKKFNGICIPENLRFYYDESGKKIEGPFSCSDIIETPKEEWRYYVANGEVLAAFWYMGEEFEVDPPDIDLKFPPSFCGAVDFGRLNNGEIILIENNLPYACGWYGSYVEGDIYLEWIVEGWEYLNKGNFC